MPNRKAASTSASSQQALDRVQQGWRTRWDFLRQPDFESELETLYLSGFRKGQRYRSMIACLLGAGIWLIFIGLDVYRLGLFGGKDGLPLPVWQLILDRVTVSAGSALLGDERLEDALYQRADKLPHQVKHRSRAGLLLGLPRQPSQTDQDLGSSREPFHSRRGRFLNSGTSSHSSR